MLKRIALAAISLYQRYLSPRKGYSCAYRVRAGGVGCSGFGKHAIEKHGIFLGLVLLRRRMAKCAWQAHQHSLKQPRTTFTRATARPNLGRFSNQAGFVDCDCGGCDVPSCDLPSCDLPDLGCGEGRAGAKALDSACFLADCGSSCNSCGSTGASREDSRLERARKRRDQAQSADADLPDFGGDGDGGD